MQYTMERLDSMSDGLDTIARMYESTEKDIVGEKPSAEAVEEVDGGGEEIWLKIFKAILSSFGLSGALAGGLIDGINGKLDIVKILKLGNKVVSKGIDKAAGASWKKILTGIETKKVGKNAVSHSCKDAFGDKVAEYSVKKSQEKAAKKAAEKGLEVTAKQKKAATGKVVTKWLGAALTVAERFKKNYEEFQGDLSNKRFWQETVTESVIEIGKDILIGAAVVAVIGSGGWTAVLATALISTGVDIATNAIAKNDDGFAENISDALINADEKWNEKKKTIKNKVTTKWSGNNISYVTA